MHGTVSSASIHGPYEISGKFLLLPISGSGIGDMTFGNYAWTNADKGEGGV